MKKITIIKAFTLLSFLFLIGIFLLYRVGKFDTYLFTEEPVIQSSHNGGKITTLTINSDSTRLTRLSSSKSMIITDRNRPLTPSARGVQITTARTTNPDSTYRARMSSSKSLVLIDNDPFIINQKKRAYLSYMLTYRFTYFQDSLRKTSKPLPPSLQIMIDSMKFNHKNINWYNLK
jgi:hypothetical protein